MTYSKTDLNWLYSNRSIHAFKVSVALLIGFLIIHMVAVPMGQWLLISIAVMMCGSATIGSILIKSYMRVLGTILGACAAMLCIAFWHNNVYATGITIFIFSYLLTLWMSGLGDFTYATTLGVATLAMIVVAPEPTLQTAAIRTIEVMVGIGVAFAVSRFVWPIRAHRVFLQEMRENLLRIAQLYDLRVIHALDRSDADFSAEVDKAIMDSFMKQRELLKEVFAESIKANVSVPLLTDFVAQQRQVYRSVYMLSICCDSAHQIQPILRNLPAFHSFNQSVYAVLHGLAQRAQDNKDLLQKLDYCNDQLTVAFATWIPKLTTEAIIDLHALQFGVQQLLQSINKLQTDCDNYNILICRA